jgi:glycine oxidase
VTTARAPDVAVLGGGIAGLSMAWELLRRGRSVRVVRSSRPRTSAMAAGMLAPMPELAINARLGRLAIEAIRDYPSFLGRLAEDSGHDPGFARSGVLRVAYEASEAEALREATGAYEAAGMPSRWLSPAALRRELSGLGQAGLVGGLLSYDEAQVQPAWLLAALEEAIARRGGQVLEAQVESLQTTAGGALVRVHGAPELEVAHVVLAMGSWSGTLPGLGYPVRPVKGQLLVFGRGSTGPPVIVYRDHNYLLTKADGTVVLGGTMEEDGGYSMEADGRAEALRDLLPRLWPGLVGADAEARVGLRPAAPDGLPVLGPLPEAPSVYIFTAHFRNGFLLCPLSSRLAVDEITEAREAELFRPMRPARLKAEVSTTSAPEGGER